MTPGSTTGAPPSTESELERKTRELQAKQQALAQVGMPARIRKPGLGTLIFRGVQYDKCDGEYETLVWNKKIVLPSLKIAEYQLR